MPTPPQMRLPKPSSDDEFEEICVDVLSQKYGEVFQRFGRKGQRQNGIDLYSNKFCVVAQCKNHQNYSHIVEEIKSDYNKAAKEFKPQKFIVATSLDRDANTQIQISKIATNIDILFWEEIQQIICNNIEILKKFYPSYMLHVAQSPQISNINQQFINTFLEICLKNHIEEIICDLPIGASFYSKLFEYEEDCYNELNQLLKSPQSVRISKNTLSGLYEFMYALNNLYRNIAECYVPASSDAKIAVLLNNVSSETLEKSREIQEWLRETYSKYRFTNL